MQKNDSRDPRAMQSRSLSVAGERVDKRGEGAWPAFRLLVDNKWFLRLVCYGAILVTWQITAMAKGEFFLPTIPATIMGIVEIFHEGHYLVLGPTLQQLFTGFFIALAIALPVGVLMGRFRVMEDLLAPYVNALFVTSKEALLPIVIILFGIGFWYRASIVIVFSVFFPIIHTSAGVRYVQRELTETARALATPPWRMFTRIYLPAAAPFVVTGIRLGLGLALVGMLIAEFWVSTGTGHLLSQFIGAPRRLDLYYGMAILIVGIAIGLSELLKWIERKLRPAMRVGG
jgi:NitT/TauT family transport system permease protein